MVNQNKSIWAARRANIPYLFIDKIAYALSQPNSCRNPAQANKHLITNILEIGTFPTLSALLISMSSLAISMTLVA